MDRKQTDLPPETVAEVGAALYGEKWVSEMARGLGVTHQYVSQIAAVGCSGMRASAILGLIARTILIEEEDEQERRGFAEDRRRQLNALRIKVAEAVA